MMLLLHQSQFTFWYILAATISPSSICEKTRLSIKHIPCIHTVALTAAHIRLPVLLHVLFQAWQFIATTLSYGAAS